MCETKSRQLQGASPTDPLALTPLDKALQTPIKAHAPALAKTLYFLNISKNKSCNKNLYYSGKHVL